MMIVTGAYNAQRSVYHTIRYDTIQYIYVRSEADEMASLISGKAQKRKNKKN